MTLDRIRLPGKRFAMHLLPRERLPGKHLSLSTTLFLTILFRPRITQPSSARKGRLTTTRMLYAAMNLSTQIYKSWDSLSKFFPSPSHRFHALNIQHFWKMMIHTCFTYFRKSCTITGFFRTFPFFLKQTLIMPQTNVQLNKDDNTKKNQSLFI